MGSISVKGFNRKTRKTDRSEAAGVLGDAVLAVGGEELLDSLFKPLPSATLAAVAGKIRCKGR